MFGEITKNTASESGPESGESEKEQEKPDRTNQKESWRRIQKRNGAARKWISPGARTTMSKSAFALDGR
jgi:hypothetical protein